MKCCVLFLASVVLVGTLVAQSKSIESAGFPAQITHVVVIVQENRTPDNLFHFLTPACAVPKGATGLAACTPTPVTSSCYDVAPCGLSNKSGKPQPIPLKGISLSDKRDPLHAHSPFDQMCDPDPANGYLCRNDGAWRITPGISYSYVTNPPVTNSNGSSGFLLGPYLTYAQQYGWANFMYQTNQGPSYPAHQFIFSGTSALSAAEDAASTFISDNPSKLLKGVGCLAPQSASVAVLSPLLPGRTPCTGGKFFDNGSVQECTVGNTELQFPNHPVGSFCSSKTTMGTLLDAQKISWKYYAPSAGSIWTAPNSIQQICDPQFKSKSNPNLICAGAEWAAKVDLNKKGADVLNDITNCNLSEVSWVIPDGQWSDHASATGNYGPSWVAAVINAIGQNPKCAAGTLNAGQTFWENTAIILTWDDWGGWTDNQPPPIISSLPCLTNDCQGDYQYGFRVPLVIVSAYTPQHFISNKTYDFGSILRTIEGIYGIKQGALGVADARTTTDLSDFFLGSFRSYTPVPALVDSTFFLGNKAQAGPSIAPDNDGDDD
jgi:hypothetical protein